MQMRINGKFTWFLYVIGYSYSVRKTSLSYIPIAPLPSTPLRVRVLASKKNARLTEHSV